MFFPRDDRPDPKAHPPHQVQLSQAAVEVALEDQIPGQAQAAVAALAASGDRFEVLIAVRLVATPGGVVFGYEGEPVDEDALPALLEAAVTFAAGLGFGFGEALTGDEAAEAWDACLPAPADASAKPAAPTRSRRLPPARRDPGEAGANSGSNRRRPGAARTASGDSAARRGRVPLARLKLVKQRPNEVEGPRATAQARLLGSY